VKEICVAFDELQKKKSSGFGNDLDRSDVGCEAPSVDGVEDDGVEVDLKVDSGNSTYNGEIMNEGISDSGSKLERCSQRRGGTESQDVKPSVSSHANDSLSLILSPEKNNRIFDGAKPKEEVLMTSSTDNSSYLREEVTAGKSVEDVCTKNHGEEQKVLTNGHKLKKIGAVSKKRCEGALEVHKTSISAVTLLKDEIDGRSIDRPESVERLKDGRVGKIESGSSKHEFSSSPLKADSGTNAGRKSKDLLNAKKRVKVADNMQGPGVDPDELAKGKSSIKEKKAQHGHGKPNCGANDVLRPSKKSKRMEMGDDATHGSHARRIKSVSPSPNVVDKKALKKPELKGSSSCVKAESNFASRAQAGIVGSNASGDEAVLPVTKRRRRAMEAMSESDTLTTDDKTERKPLLAKNDVSCSNNVGVSGSQLHKKRRAVCLFDDEDDEPKTPVHGGSARIANASAFVSDATKSSDAHNNSCKNAQQVGVSIGFEDGHLKESSSELCNDSLSPSERQTDEKSPEKAAAGYLPHCPGKLYSEQLSSKEQFSSKEQLSSKEAKSVLISPRKSPQSGPTEPVAEQHKVAKPLVNVCGTGPQKKAQLGSAKGSGVVSNSTNSAQNQGTIKRNMPSSGERFKTTPKSISRIGESTVLTESSVEYNSFPSERCAHFLIFLIHFLFFA
jgi:hypothetical protein